MRKEFGGFILACILVTLSGDLKGTSPPSQWKKLVSNKKEILKKLSDLEEKSKECELKTQEEKERLYRQRQNTIKSLPLLLRVGRTNPFQLFVDLRSTENAIRSLILIRSFLFSMQQQMRRVKAELHELKAFEEDLNLQKNECKNLLQRLTTHLSDLQVKGKKAIEDFKNKEDARLEGETDISVLLEESRAVLSKTKENTSKKAVHKGLPFGMLENPVRGKRIREKELQKKFSTHKLGILYKTAKGESVRAAAKGKVAFKGPFLSQGDILIIDHGQDVHTVYMGIEKISVETGQSVYAGEIIGTMAGHGKNPPLLYLELREKGKPADALPYMEDM